MTQPPDTNSNKTSPHLSRADFLKWMSTSAAALGLPGMAAAQAAMSSASPAPSASSASARAIPTRPIPSSGEPLPVIGLGTYVGFDVDRGTPEYARLPEVVRTLFEAGGSVIDSSPMYGRAESVTGQVLKDAGTRERAFVATKVWTQGRDAGIRQMQKSMSLLQTGRIDLMQVHNLVDWKTHLSTLKGWKAEGKVRYVGVTHYTASAYPQLEAVLKSETLDFVQINYALDDREAEKRILPLARDRGIAVLVNTPFGGGGLLRSLLARPLPAWAPEWEAASWAQLLLKFVLSHPAVSCAIPGTSRASHMADNAAAALGRLPDASARERLMEALRSA